MLQLQLLKRTGTHPARTMEHQKFRAAFDLLAMRAEVEGGETVEQAKFLEQCGCDVAQGYYYSKPVPPEEFEKEAFVKSMNDDKK